MYLNILQPCHEDWEKMTPYEKGRFCSLCQKNVVDFTNMSDKEMLNFLQENPNACGRFRKSQLNRTYHTHPRTIAPISPYISLPKWKKSLIAASLFLSLQTPIFSQNVQNIQVKGVIKDKATKQVVPYALAILYENTKDTNFVEVAKINTDETGKYQFSLLPDKQYKIVANGVEYLANDIKVSTLKNNTNYNSNIIEKNIFIEVEPIEMGNMHRLENVYFDENKYFLREDAKYELNKTIELLLKNPQVTVQIGGHAQTDEAGENTYNLSDMRAKAVLKYFIDKGVVPERLSWIAFGDQVLIYQNEKNDMEKQVNRRVEFRITSLDYKKT